MKDNGVERRVCLGDLVGYGADPDESVRLARENMDICIIGNHDSVAIKHESSAGFKKTTFALCMPLRFRPRTGCT